jgi:DNA-binding GntR family transcriptional regulator
METVIPPLETRSQLKDEAAAHIRGLIASGQVQSGELMRLAPLAERVGASVTPVREALILLAQDGWVVQEPNRGFRVAPITRRDVSDDYWVHAQVAGELAARLARMIDKETLALLRRLDQQIRNYDTDDSNDDDSGALEELNLGFHHVLNTAADSPRLLWYSEAASRFVLRRFWGTIPGWPEHNRYGHAGIVEALAAGDAARSRAEIIAHVDRARDLVLTHLDTIGFWSARDLP